MTDVTGVTGVLERVSMIVAKQFGAPASAISRETMITAGGPFDADSLDHVEITMDAEEACNLALADDELEQVKTVGDLVDLIERRRKADA